MREKRILVFGSSGTAGRAVVRELLNQNYLVRTFGRSKLPDWGQEQIVGNLSEMEHDLFVDVSTIISCLASRNGDPSDAWEIDYKANSEILKLASTSNVSKFILLSAICVQKPKLAFQHAKLAFEDELSGSGMDYSIIRPTAFFKSLSGQLERVRGGKPFLVFGDGRKTSCLPISDADLARFMVTAIHDPNMNNRILPVGGPGEPISPIDQAVEIADLLGVDPKIRRVPMWFFNGIVGGLGLISKVFPRLRQKAELAKIGQYYGTESMLVWDAERGVYSADQTPQFGNDTLFEHYKTLIEQGKTDELGAHKVF